MPSLRLRIDPPYEGESLSSFLERAAQAYGTPLDALLRELANGHPPSSRRIDLDRNPSNDLLDGLDRAVFDWKSPHANVNGFRHWVLAPRHRSAYCPLCFEADLESGRTPYFRNDWMAFCVTSCWRHRTPLFNWPVVGAVRRRPKHWLDPGARSSRPPFFQQALEQLESLRGQVNESPEVHHCVVNALDAISSLQRHIEKPSTQPLPTKCDLRTKELDDMFYLLAQFAIDRPALLGSAIEPIAELLRPRSTIWFGARPKSLRPRKPDLRSYAFRLCGDVHWRRSLMWFVVRTLAGHDAFRWAMGKTLPGRVCWEQWWDTEVNLACTQSGRQWEFATMRRELERSTKVIAASGKNAG